MMMQRDKVNDIIQIRKNAEKSRFCPSFFLTNYGKTTITRVVVVLTTG